MKKGPTAFETLRDPPLWFIEMAASATQRDWVTSPRPEDRLTSRRRARSALATWMVLLCLAALALPAVPPSAAATVQPDAFANAPCGQLARPHRIRHVVWIVLENIGYAVVGSPHAPYLNSLARSCGLATADHAVSHPSLPNYLALVSGSTQGVTDDAGPSVHPLGVPSIFSQLSGNWHAYADSMPIPCDRVTSGTYAARHNPAVYFRSLGSTCGRRDLPGIQPINVAAAFTFVAPNICDDMHSCAIEVGDAWLARAVGGIVASAQYRAGTVALFITFDESNTDGTNHVPTIVVAPSVPRGLRVGVAFTHYSLLRTTESLLGLPLLGAARSAASMTVPFRL